MTDFRLNAPVIGKVAQAKPVLTARAVQQIGVQLRLTFAVERTDPANPNGLSAEIEHALTQLKGVIDPQS